MSDLREAARANWLESLAAFLNDYSQYSEGDQKMPWQTLRLSLVQFLEDSIALRAALAAEDGRVSVPRGAMLWLWKNGPNEFWAFDNPYPCYHNGDPMILGEPVGYALLKQSLNGRP